VDRSPAAGGLQLLRRGARRAVGRGRLAAALVTARRPPVDDRPPPREDVRLVAVDPAQRTVLANLIQLYRHDMSEHRGYELDETGTYPYVHLDDYLSGPDRESWFIRVEGHLAGFVLTHRLPDGVWQVSEFFVVRPYRRRGVGRIALAKAFQLHDGRWTCFVDESNGISERMCVKAAVDAAGHEVKAGRGLSRTGIVGTVFRLSVPATPAPASTGCCAPAATATDVEPEPEEPGPLTCC
jgi:predicted acetyltransferase